MVAIRVCMWTYIYCDLTHILSFILPHKIKNHTLIPFCTIIILYIAPILTLYLWTVLIWNGVYYYKELLYSRDDV